nr:uncharacterized protein LOC109190933 [Ipomoea batatas]
MGRKTTRYLSAEERFAAHQYVLLNCEEVQPILRMYENGLRHYNPGCTDEDVDDEIERNFAAWFKEYVYAPMNNVCNQSLIDLASGPVMDVCTYTGYVVNGFKFQTEEYCRRKSTSNFGVSIKGSGLSQFESNFFGTLQEVVEIEYPNIPIKKVVLFKCEWFDPTPNVGSRYNSEYSIAEVHCNKRYRNSLPSPTPQSNSPPPRELHDSDSPSSDRTVSESTTSNSSSSSSQKRITIRPVGTSFEPFGAHRGIIKAITRIFPDAIKTYRVATYEEQVHKNLEEGKAKPDWMNDHVLAQYRIIWDSEGFKKNAMKNKINRNSDCGGLGPSLHTAGSIPITEHRRRLETVIQIQQTQPDFEDSVAWYEAAGGLKKGGSVFGFGSDSQHYFPKAAKQKNSKSGEPSTDSARDEQLMQLKEENKYILEKVQMLEAQLAALRGINLPSFQSSPNLHGASSHESSGVGLDDIGLNDDTQFPLQEE